MFYTFRFLLLLVAAPFALAVFWYGMSNRDSPLGKVILVGFITGGLLLSTLIIIGILSKKKVLDREDFHGTFVVDRSYFKGMQVDWQYEHYRFEITEQDSILFHVTDGRQIMKTYRGTVSYPSPYGSARLHLCMELPTHHILSSDPTIYRSAWDYYVVFHSPRYHNVFFRRGEWLPIEE